MKLAPLRATIKIVEQNYVRRVKFRFKGPKHPQTNRHLVFKKNDVSYKCISTVVLEYKTHFMCSKQISWSWERSNSAQEMHLHLHARIMGGLIPSAMNASGGSHLNNIITPIDRGPYPTLMVFLARGNDLDTKYVIPTNTQMHYYTSSVGSN
jgi:hypothetical protein